VLAAAALARLILTEHLVALEDLAAVALAEALAL
jgi:hypothetical protein